MLKAKQYPAAGVVIAVMLWAGGPARPQSYPGPDPRGGNPPTPTPAPQE